MFLSYRHSLYIVGVIQYPQLKVKKEEVISLMLSMYYIWTTSFQYHATVIVCTFVDWMFHLLFNDVCLLVHPICQHLTTMKKKY